MLMKSENPFLVLYTTSVENTEYFFRTLGISFSEVTIDKVVVTIGGFELHYILNTSEPFSDYHYIANPIGYGQGIIFYIETSDLIQIKKQIKDAGGTIVSDIFENKWNCLELLIEDPNGYKFAFYQSMD